MDNITDIPQNTFNAGNIKLISAVYVLHFAQALIFLISSFMIFFVKRTEGYDPRLISGAYQGTIQLSVFIILNIGTILAFFAGFYLMKFSRTVTEQNAAKRYILFLMINLVYFIALTILVSLRFLYFK